MPKRWWITHQSGVVWLT